MIEKVLEFTKERVSLGERVVLITVTGTQGSSPASAGQVMAVAADGTTTGTVGGGASEHRLAQRAVEALRAGEQVFEFSIDHGENGMVCGGVMKGFGNMLGGGHHLYLFGGGHIAQCLAPLATTTGFFVTVVEDRPDLAESFPGIRYLVSTPEEYGEKISFTGSAYAVICTRGHQADLEALRFCLAHPLQYTGMIGSAKKVGAVFQRLRREGCDDHQLNRVYSPIGLDIASAIPAEIAVSIMAEMLLVKNSGTLRHKGISAQSGSCGEE